MRNSPPKSGNPYASVRVGGRALASLLLTVCLAASPVAWAQATPPGDAGTGGAASVRVANVHVGRGQLGRPTTTAYVHVYDRADPPITRSAVTGLPGTAFSATERGTPVTVTATASRQDEPVALVVIADTSNDRGWLPRGPKHADPIGYLRDAAMRILKEFPESGRFALYSMAPGAEGTPPLADRQTALNTVSRLQAASEARLLERIERAIDALRTAPPEWRRVIVVLSDGNSAFGRNYELVAAAATREQVAVFAAGTVDREQAFPFLEWLGRETGGQSWLFDKAALQPTSESPVLLDLLADQIVRAIKSAYRLEYASPASSLDARELNVTAKLPSGDVLRSKPVTYSLSFETWPPIGLSLTIIGLLLTAALAAGLYHYRRLRPARTDFFLIGHGPTAGHVAEEYLYTGWRPLGRGGQGYQLQPEDPHFAGLSRTHVSLCVRNWRRVRGSSGQEQSVGTVEVRAGRPSNGVGLNTAFVYNDLTGVRALSERPYQLQSGDLLILQAAGQMGQSVNGLPHGVYLRLGHVAGTSIENHTMTEIDSDKTLVETLAEAH